jgi:membrane protease YdiL (CAAX protease family)
MRHVRRVPAADPYQSETRHADLVLAVGLALFLCLYNNVVAGQPWHRRRYVVANLTATMAVLAVADSRGLKPDQLGLAAARARAGARLGGKIGAVVLTGVAVAVAVPASRPWLRDARVEELRWPAVAYLAVVRVPVGTVLWEEIAFRGVLLGIVARMLPVGGALAATSAMFGVWHIRPTLEALRLNRVATTPRRAALAVAVSVGGTGLAGGLLSGLRLRSGSLLAPILVHLAANSGAALGAAVAGRSSQPVLRW